MLCQLRDKTINEYFFYKACYGKEFCTNIFRQVLVQEVIYGFYAWKN